MMMLIPPHHRTGSGNSRGFLSQPVSSLGVLPLQAGAGFEQEAQCSPSGHSRVRGPAEEAGTLCGRHHAVHWRPPPTGWVQTCAQGSRWEPVLSLCLRLENLRFFGVLISCIWKLSLPRCSAEGAGTPAGFNDKRLCFSSVICRQSDGNALCELWRSHREQAKPHMCCPEGQRVKRQRLLGVHTEKHAGFVPHWVDL